MNANTNTNMKVRPFKMTALTFKKKTMAMILAVAAAVVLPQIVHVGGKMMGVNSALGEMLLPMHFPVLLVGLMAGSYAGASAGMLAPVVSYALTGMPALPMLPFIIIELTAYGFASGLLKNRKLPVLGKVFMAQLAGRALRFVAVVVAVYGLGSTSVTVSAGWTNITTGMIGMLLQLAFIPVILHFADVSN